MTKRENKSPSRSTKRALTSSVLALVLCFVMLLGTTFAWFTDAASTKVNTIQAGNLKVDLEMKSGDTWLNAEGRTLNFIQSEKSAAKTILWEPGCTYELPEVRVVNNGNLALKYKVVISAVVGEANLAEVLDVEVKSVETARAESEWVNVGTLAEVLGQDFDTYMTGTLEPDANDPIQIRLHMQETAGNAYQNQSVSGIAITVLAAQATVEFDSYTDQYDKKATFDVRVATAEELDAALDVGGNIVLTSNIEMTGYASVDRNANIDLNGYNIIREGTTNSNTALYVTNAELNIYGTGTVAAFSAAVWAADGAVVNIYGGTYKGTQAVYATSNGVANIYGGTYKTADGQDSTYVLNIQDGARETAKITVYGGTFENYDPSKSNSENPEENFVADGYKSIQRGKTYYVVANGSDLVAERTAVASGTTTLSSDVSAVVDATNGIEAGSSTYALYAVSNGATLDGKGHTLNVVNGGATAGVTVGNGSVKNLTITGAWRGVMVHDIAGNVTIDNVVIDGCGYALNTGSKANGVSGSYKLTVKNSTLNGWSSWANLVSASFTNCSFGSSTYYSNEAYQHLVRPYVTTTFTNCDFEKGFYIQLDNLAENGTITLSNCTCDGVKLTSENFADYVKIVTDFNNHVAILATNNSVPDNVTIS